MLKLILVRHGETEWNKQGRYQGQTAELLGGKDLPVHSEPRLREISFGVLEGLTWKEAERDLSFERKQTMIGDRNMYVYET